MSTAASTATRRRVVGAWGAEVCVVGSALFQRGRDTADEVRLVREGVIEGRRALRDRADGTVHPRSRATGPCRRGRLASPAECACCSSG